MKNIMSLLSGGDLRSISGADKVVTMIKNQEDFDELVQGLLSGERLTVMRCADVIEKITAGKTGYLQAHKKTLLKLMQTAADKELKWHLAQLMPRLTLTKTEFLKVWDKLLNWASDKTESRIVRVNAIQGLFGLLPGQVEYIPEFIKLMDALEKENIPSLNARIKQLKNKLTV
jgi:hypothetical protein